MSFNINVIMATFWFYYFIGFVIAFLMITVDYYSYNPNKVMFNNLDDLKKIFLFSLGSWLTVIYLVFNDDD